MQYILRKKGWSLATLEGIIHQMKRPMGILHSEEPPLAADMVFRWGCTSNLLGDPKVVNKAKAIHAVYHKKDFRKVLQNEKLCPQTWFKVESIVPQNFPVIVRPARHAQGLELYLCNNFKELDAAWGKVGGDGYISSFIDKIAEYRYFVANNRVVTVYKKLPKKDGMMLWNDYEEYVPFEDWPMSHCTVAIEAHNLSGLHWSAIDIIEDVKGQPYILEINTTPEIQSPYRQRCMAKVFDFIIDVGRDSIPTKKKPMNWKDVIHPAISVKAFI